jgi:hypothetical protein
MYCEHRYTSLDSFLSLFIALRERRKHFTQLLFLFVEGSPEGSLAGRSMTSTVTRAGTRASAKANASRDLHSLSTGSNLGKEMSSLVPRTQRE